MAETFLKLLKEDSPLKIVGTINAYSALLAKKVVIKQFIFLVLA
jgi:2-methylisocitrate lyase-like PEP mutase family enzyme